MGLLANVAASAVKGAASTVTQGTTRAVKTALAEGTAAGGRLTLSGAHAGLVNVQQTVSQRFAGLSVPGPKGAYQQRFDREQQARLMRG